MDQRSSQAQTPASGLGAARPAAGSSAAAVRRTGTQQKKSLNVRLKDYFGSFLFLVPYLVFFLAFILGPLIYAFWVSLHRWSTIGGNLGWSGLQHYHRILLEPSSISAQDFWLGLRHTLFFVIVSVPLLVLLALSLALLLANAPWRNFFRALFYIPAVLSVTVAASIWLWIFQPGGLIGTYLHSGTAWLVTTTGAWTAIIVMTLWWTVGFNMVILLAGIMEVPNDYHEAAKIDGANVWQRIWSITLPILRPILAFVTITQMLASFGLFGQPYVMTGGGPSRATEPIVITILNKAFGPDQDLATASAMSFILGVILIVLALIQVRIFRLGEA